MDDAYLASMLHGDDSESRVQSAIRLEAPQKGVRLFRNNVGVLFDRNDRPVRYGLANDSPALNRHLKSGDLIGWRRVLVTPDMVGQLIAQIVSRECKPEGWEPCGPGNKDLFAHESAQRAWAKIINDDGGDARFATGVGTL